MAVIVGILGLIVSLAILFTPYTGAGTGERSFAIRNVMQSCSDPHVEVEPADPGAYYEAQDRCLTEAWIRVGVGCGVLAVSAVGLMLAKRPRLSGRIRDRQPAWP